MKIKDYLQKLKSTPTSITFTETMQVIEDNFRFTPTAFMNGKLNNNAGENSGSCKLFAFAKLQKLTKQETLFCFGEHYQTVLNDVNGTSHQNIRNFIKTGFGELTFESEVLALK